MFCFLLFIFLVLEGFGYWIRIYWKLFFSRNDWEYAKLLFFSLLCDVVSHNKVCLSSSFWKQGENPHRIMILNNFLHIYFMQGLFYLILFFSEDKNNWKSDSPFLCYPLLSADDSSDSGEQIKANTIGDW